MIRVLSTCPIVAVAIVMLAAAGCPPMPDVPSGPVADRPTPLDGTWAADSGGDTELTLEINSPYFRMVGFSAGPLGQQTANAQIGITRASARDQHTVWSILDGEVEVTGTLSTFTITRVTLDGSVFTGADLQRLLADRCSADSVAVEHGDAPIESAFAAFVNCLSSSGEKIGAIERLESSIAGTWRLDSGREEAGVHEVVVRSDEIRLVTKCSSKGQVNVVCVSDREEYTGTATLEATAITSLEFQLYTVHYTEEGEQRIRSVGAEGLVEFNGHVESILPIHYYVRDDYMIWEWFLDTERQYYRFERLE